MPRDYSRGKIYKIIDNTSNLIYVGSTCEPTLAMRLAKHVACYKHWKKGKKGFVSSFNIIENGDYTIVLLESFPCENSDQLRAREQHYKELIKSNNIRNPYSGLTIQEFKKKYYIENKEQIQEHHKKYRKENQEKIQEQQKQKHTCFCGGKFTTQNKSTHLKSLKHQAYVQACAIPTIP
jgi:hypothetical protein